MKYLSIYVSKNNLINNINNCTKFQILYENIICEILGQLCVYR